MQSERMWVSVTGREGDFYHGHLDNQPHTPGALRLGATVWFRAEHVIDHAGPDGEGQASRAADLVHCERHGPSTPCYVCEHLAGGGAGQGFNTAANNEDARPDAWCDACDRLLDLPGVAEWDDLPKEQHPRITLLCGGCYDRARERNESPDG